jgi:hypothetical protein
VVNTLLRSSSQGTGDMGTSFEEFIPGGDVAGVVLRRPGD